MSNSNTHPHTLTDNIMYVHTATTDRTNVYTTTLRSEYFSDVLAEVSHMEADYTNRKHIEKIDTIIDMDVADCLYYTMVVTYHTTCEMTKAFAARLVEIAAENAAWEATKQVPIAVAAEVAEVPAEAVGKAKIAVVVNGVHVEDADFKDTRMTSNVGKFVKGMWNNETEDNMWYWIRTNHEKFPEYANALKLVLGEEHEKLDWYGLDQD